MSSDGPSKAVASNLVESLGLPFEKFLSTLDWASESHPLSSTPQDSQLSCTVCKPSKTSSASEELALAIDRVEGNAYFRVAKEHKIHFSSLQRDGSPTVTIPTLLSVEDGKLKLGFDITAEGRKKCLTVEGSRVVDPPIVRKTDTAVVLEVAFPFVTLVLEKLRWNPNEHARPPTNHHESAFAAMKEAIALLRETYSEKPHGAYAESENHANVTCFEAKVESVMKAESSQISRLRPALDRFIAQGIPMVIPQCFPYTETTKSSGIYGIEKEDHVAFADAFVSHEVARKLAQEQQRAWVDISTRKRKSGDRVLSESEIESRRVKRREGPCL